mmetsp:Transcript_4425/g.15525  ORF Transcript_4425/g.15525 Transcript_4425/m.15525 type:complete len:265 (+) Transcript_4425:1663-2457(+)
MERLSFPPSQAMPSLIIESLRARAASYMAAPSPSILAAYIQFTDDLMSSIEVSGAHMMLVTASATARRAMAAGSSIPLSGCSPMEQAPPVMSSKVWATTATSARGSCRGPTHCCWATSPETDLSTLVVRNLLEQTPGSLRTLRTASPTGMALVLRGTPLRSPLTMSYFFLGILPRTFSRSRSSGVTSPGPAFLSLSTILPSPLMTPMKETRHLSLSAIFSSSSLLSGLISRQSFSWYSAPQISSTDMVSSPTLISRMSISAPSG